MTNNDEKKLFLVLILLLALAGGAFWYFNQNETLTPEHSTKVTENSYESEYTGEITDSAHADAYLNEEKYEVSNVEENPDPELEKWIGKYRLKIEQQEGDDAKYWAFAEISVNPDGDCNFNYWFADYESEETDDDITQVYGQYTLQGDSLQFVYEVKTGGPDNGNDPELTLFQENGNYYIKSPQFYANRADGKIKIEKLK